MKRLLLSIFLLIAMFQYTVAQSGLQIDRLFDGHYKKQKNAIEVLVKGKKLEPYKLSLFRSLTVKGTEKDFEELEKLVLKDAASAIDKEVGMIGGKLYYGFYRFPNKKTNYRYLFYRNASLQNPISNEVTLVYMEGVSTLDELKKLFK